MRSRVLVAAGVLAVSLCAGPALAQQVAVPEIKKMGFVSIIPGHVEQ